MKQYYPAIFITINFLACQFVTQAQIVSISPANATTDSDITLTYNAALGNKALEGFSGNVYVYTGVITTESSNNSDWKHVQSNWGTANPKTLLTRINQNLYSISFNIREFYGIAPGEEVIKLALLFHNENYSLVGRDSDGRDIFADINLSGTGNYLTHHQTGSTLNVTTDSGNLLVGFFASNIVKSEFIPNAGTASDTSFTVVLTKDGISPLLEEKDKFLRFSRENLSVVIWKEPVKVSYIKMADTLLHESPGFFSQAAGGGIKFEAKPDIHYYGGGAHAIPFERSGKTIRIYNEARYGYGINTSPLNTTIPFIVTTDGYGLFFDNHYPGTISFPPQGQSALKYTTEGGRLRYYFISGSTNDDILDAYTKLTGKQPLPPLWSMGYIQSKFGYESQTEATAMVNNLRADGFPLDALVLDLYWFGQPNDMGNLDWNYSKWPNPTQMMSNFKDIGVKTILITEPYFTLNSTNYQYLEDNNLFATTGTGDPFVLWGFWAGNAALLDLTQQAAQDWMWSLYSSRRNEGVGGWWLDLGEPETHPREMQHEFGPAISVHNIYSLIWARMLYENYRRDFPEERLFNLIRSGYAGMQRYSTFPWSGDIQRTFDGLKVQIPIMLSMGMNGVGYMHSDVGGFVGNNNDSELFTRWVQFGVFAPVLRLHGVGTTSPLDFPSAYRNLVRKYIRLRYQMLPYNYNLAYKNSVSGTPLALPMNYFEPENALLARVDDQYLWGENLLIAPVMERGKTQRNVVFPEGKWIDYDSNTIYNGNAAYSVSAPIEKIPVFARAGSFIPQANLVLSTSEYTTDTLYTLFFPDNSVSLSSYTLFTDNGKDPLSLENSEYELIHFAGNVNEHEIVISLSKEGNGFAGSPEDRNMFFELRRIWGEPESVLIGTEPASRKNSIEELYANEPSWYFHAGQNKLFVHTNWTGGETSILINKSPVAVFPEVTQALSGAIIHTVSPNPFNNRLTISLDIIDPSVYTLTVYNMTGQPVFTDQLNMHSQGRYSYEWTPGSTLPSGLYLLQVKGSTGVHSVKVIRQ